VNRERSISFTPREDLNTCIVFTPWGWAGLAATSHGLWACTWPWKDREKAGLQLESTLKRAASFKEKVLKYQTEHLLKQAAQALLAFFHGSLQQLQDVPLDTRRFTNWQQKVYAAASAIPPGEVRSYGWIAKECGKPGGARAVGQALAANPLPLFIPCHRVIYGDGRLGNYGSGGPELKARLLAFEKKGEG